MYVLDFVSCYLCTDTAADRLFLKAFSSLEIEKQCSSVRQVHPGITRSDLVTLETIVRVFDRLDKKNLPKTRKALESCAGVTLNSLGCARDHIMVQTVLLSLCRQSVMLAEYQLQTVLEEQILPALLLTVASIQDNNPLPTDDSDVYDRLVYFVWRKLVIRQPIVAHSHTFIPDLVPPRVAYHGILEVFPTPEILRKRVPLVAMSILRSWYHLSDDFNSQGRRYFVQTILSTVGRKALLLPAVWDAYNDLPLYLQNRDCHTYMDRRKNTFKEGAFSHLKSVLALCPVAQAHSTDGQTLKTLADLYEDLKETLDECADTTILVTPSVLNIKVSETTCRSLARIRQAAVPHVDSVQIVLRLLTAGWHAVLGTSMDDPLVQQIYKDSDRLQPLREYSVSRTKINGIDGDHLNRDTGRTSSGLFSFLVFRNILYRSSYLRGEGIDSSECRTVFQSGEDFHQHIVKLQSKYLHTRKENFFCSRNALGSQTIIQRSLQNYEVCWRSAQDSEWELLNSHRHSMTWENAVKFMNDLDKRHRVPGYGPLTRYLVLTDMVYAEVVEMPTAMEVGTVIAGMRAGSFKAMKNLGYLVGSANALSVEQIARGFEQFYLDVASVLAADLVATFAWSPIIAEHTLCKVSRLYEELTSE